MPLYAGKLQNRPGVHDLLLLNDEEAFVSNTFPDVSVERALRMSRVVVVRFGPHPGNLIPVFVIGEDPSTRVAGFISLSSIAGRIQPENLAAKRAWEASPRRLDLVAIRYLEEINDICISSGYAWGPIGSLAYELVTKRQVNHPDASIDIIVRADDPIPRSQAVLLANRLSFGRVAVNVRLDTPAGEVSLAEYIERSVVAAYTNEGLRFLSDPWSTEEDSALVLSR